MNSGSSKMVLSGAVALRGSVSLVHGGAEVVWREMNKNWFQERTLIGLKINREAEGN